MAAELEIKDSVHKSESDEVKLEQTATLEIADSYQEHVSTEMK